MSAEIQGLFRALAVVCSQGEVIPDLVRRLASTDGLPFDGPIRAAKGSTWALSLAGIYWLRGDAARVRTYGDSARIAMEEQVRDAPEDGQLRVLLGTAMAYAGRKTDAVREGLRGVELDPISRDANVGAYALHQLVRIYIVVGEQEKALDALEKLVVLPYDVSPGWLRIDPTFDSLRKSPRFRSLIEQS